MYNSCTGETWWFSKQS